MELGDRIKFKFGSNQRELEGKIVKLFEKTVILKVDFPNHKGKIVRRKRHQLK